jgi:hypothetical protein
MMNNIPSIGLTASLFSAIAMQDKVGSKITFCTIESSPPVHPSANAFGSAKPF